jgi:hypothetical protein
MATRSRRSRGRGTAAAFGFVLLFGGLIAGGVMFVIASRLHDQAIEDFARAGVGCRTTLEFDGTGTFYVFKETAGRLDVADGNCVPVGEPDQAFGVEQRGGPAEVAFTADDSIEYDADGFVGRSVSSFVVDEPGIYEISVHGPDAGEVAAIGRDPASGVDRTRLGAVALAAAGVVLGGLLLGMAGRRSKRAATPSIPDGPGWGPVRDSSERAWPPAPPAIAQRPVNPQQPDQPASVTPPAPPLPARTPAGNGVSPWAPPTVDSSPVDAAPPTAEPPTRRVPLPEPKLPDR